MLSKQKIYSHRQEVHCQHTQKEMRYDNVVLMEYHKANSWKSKRLATHTGDIRHLFRKMYTMHNKNGNREGNYL